MGVKYLGEPAPTVIWHFQLLLCRVGLRAIAIRTYAWAPETGFFKEYVGHTKYFRKKTRFLWLGA